MNKHRILATPLAAVWGICATWIFWWLFSSVCCGMLFSASVPRIQALLRSGWTTQQIAPYLHSVIAVLPALFYGFIFGMPLGLLATRSVVAIWLTFIAAFLVALAVRMFLANYDIYGVLENLASPIYFLTFLATLLFAVAAYRARSAYANRRAAA